MDQIKKTLKNSAKARWAMMIIVSFLMAANYCFYGAFFHTKKTK